MLLIETKRVDRSGVILADALPRRYLRYRAFRGASRARSHSRFALRSVVLEKALDRVGCVNPAVMLLGRTRG
jgi:hypothetical protein